MKLLRNILCVIFFIVIFILSFIYLIHKKGPVFNYNGQAGSYSTALLKKYDYLVSLKNKKKIIVIGGSGVAFGLNEELLKKETGYEVVNFGLHAAMGQRIMLEMSKTGINEGDIIVLAFELEYLKKSDNYLDKIGLDLVLQGLDNRIALYKHFYFKSYKEIFSYLPRHYDKYIKNFKPEEIGGAYGVYDINSFNEKGYMVYERNEFLETFSEIQLRLDLVEDISLHKNFLKVIKNYKKFVEKKGGRLYFVMTPVVDLSITTEKTKEILITAPKKVEEQTGIPFVSKQPLEYLFPKELMYDTTYHCNTKGAEYRTILLIKDLKENGIIKN